MRNSGKALLGLMLEHKGEKTSNRFRCLPPERGRACLLNGVRVGVGSWVGLETKGWLRWSAHPLDGAVCSVHVQVPCFCSRHLRSGSWVLGLFVSYS